MDEFVRWLTTPSFSPLVMVGGFIVGSLIADWVFPGRVRKCRR